MVLAQAWHDQIQTGNAKSRADLARQPGVARAYVTQVLRLLDLAPEVQQKLLSLGDPTEGLVIGAHTLRSLTKLPAMEQEARVLQLIRRNGQ